MEDPKKSVREFVEALKENKTEIEAALYKPYSRILMEAAIPTAMVVIGVLSVTAAVILIDRRVGIDTSTSSKLKGIAE
jgi:hypothetical protein